MRPACRTARQRDPSTFPCTPPTPATGLYTLVDYLNTIPSLPRIRDGANIQFLAFATGATTSGGTVYANLEAAWG